ncbi:DUF4232 domain-containing protein [Actinophytocola sp.]|jgi:hypothetical protein|uniref:DUF4232 domain-containing protein n=1 Tax=Actinophytocola sp. TaxID=1872138 RepID=UPI002ED9E725
MSRAALLVGGVTIALLTAGCQNATTGANSPDVPSITEAAGTPPSTQAPPASSSTPQAQPPVNSAAKPAAEKPKPAATNPNECKVADLKLSLAGGDAAAGTTYRQLRFTNSGHRTCTIQGFPGVSYVAGNDGHQVGPAAYRDGRKGPAITLKPGQMAYAPLGFVQVRNYDPAVCKPTAVRGLRVYPPHEYSSMYLAAPGTGCAGTPPGNQLVLRTIRR